LTIAAAGPDRVFQRRAAAFPVPHNCTDDAMIPTLQHPVLVLDLSARTLGLEQTHISWVFLGEGEVWKVKKPVDFGFLDYGSLEKRKRACEDEVALNRVLTPSVYLGVVPITLDASGLHRFGGEGVPVEWAVHMRRLPEADRADRRLAAGNLPSRWITGLAERIAGFHAGGRSDAWTAKFGSLKAIRANALGNFGQSRAFLPGLIGAGRADGLKARFRDFLRVHAGLFAQRAEGGRVRDGHGDLRLGQIYFDASGAPSILDRIEFNDRLRFGDVCSDIAFLAMDLEYRGRKDLAERFLAAYAAASGDFGLYSLVGFYESYRACVRGKVAWFQGEDPECADAERMAAIEEARGYFTLAESLLKPAVERPKLIAVGGGIATGKSTLSAELSERLAAPVLSSDRTRKQMAGLDPWMREDDPIWQGLYSEDVTERVYAEMLRWGRFVWESGRSVIVDASFRTRRHREAFRTAAREAGIGFHFIECRADRETCRERLRLRALEPAISDGRETIFEDFLASWEQCEGFPDDEYSWVDTTAPLERALPGLLGRLSS
jgi:aminoglycoside phosphotransferase family enzyme/predicted kinase